MKLPVKVTEPNVIKFALAIIADAKRAAINNFSFMLLVSLTCTNYARVKVVGRFGDKICALRLFLEHRHTNKFFANSLIHRYWIA